MFNWISYEVALFSLLVFVFGLGFLFGYLTRKKCMEEKQNGKG